MRVPDWLGHLRTDARGRPVPFVNRWGLDEKPALTGIQFDPNVGGNAVFYFDAEEAEPNFKAQSMQRQRRCMVLGECQVCGRPVPWRRRHLVISTVSTGTVSSPGPLKGSISVGEPWLDRRCAEFAMKYCPALLRRAHGEDLDLVSVTSKHDVQMIIKAGAVDGYPETWKEPVAMWVEIVLKVPPVLVAV